MAQCETRDSRFTETPTGEAGLAREVCRTHEFFLLLYRPHAFTLEVWVPRVGPGLAV